MSAGKRLPSQKDINVYDSLDEQCAAKNFLGKDLDEAEALFRDNAFVYHEDLMFMGPVAFCFYVRAYINYLKSECSTGDSDNANAFQGLVNYRLDHDGPAIDSVIPVLLEAVEYMMANLERFEIIPDIYGDVGLRYAALRCRLTGSSV